MTSQPRYAVLVFHLIQSLESGELLQLVTNRQADSQLWFRCKEHTGKNRWFAAVATDTHCEVSSATASPTPTYAANSSMDSSMQLSNTAVVSPAVVDPQAELVAKI